MAIQLTNDGRPLLRNGAASALVPATPVDPPTESRLTLNEFANQRVFQRIGNSAAVVVTGNYLDATPAAIQARVVDAATGAAKSNWTALSGAVIADGSFTGTLQVPQGGWYALQVRDAATPGGVTTGANKWGVGIVWALIGQSNNDGFMTIPFDYPIGDPRAVRHDYATSSYRRMGILSATLAPNSTKRAPGYPGAVSDGNPNDGPTYFANLLSEITGLPVCLVWHSANGQAIDVWVGSQTAWNAFVTKLNVAGGDCEGATLYQGESNSANGTSTASYAASLATLQQQLHTQTSRNASSFNFGITSLGSVSDASSYSGGSTTRVGAIRAAQVQFANNTPGAFMVTSALDTITTDGVHVNGEGFNRLGRRYAKSVAARLGFGNSCAGPRAISASRVGLDVTITVQHAGGSTLKDGTGGNGASLTGFELKDSSGNVIAITNTSIASPTTIHLTAASGPAPATVSYGMGNTPHTTSQTDARTALVLASIVYDDATYLAGDTAPFGQSAVGAPLQPFAPINISGG